MKYLTTFKESIKDIYLNFYKNILEDIEDCLLHISDKFYLHLKPRDNEFQNYNYYTYIYKVKFEKISSFLLELNHVSNDLKRIKLECGFDINWSKTNWEIDSDNSEFETYWNELFGVNTYPGYEHECYKYRENDGSKNGDLIFNKNKFIKNMNTLINRESVKSEYSDRYIYIGVFII